jgi:hypothetical protein
MGDLRTPNNDDRLVARWKVVLPTSGFSKVAFPAVEEALPSAYWEIHARGKTAGGGSMLRRTGRSPSGRTPLSGAVTDRPIGAPVPRVVTRRDTGAAAVEFALVASVLIVLVFGIVDFGWLFNRTTLITNATREGAREGAVTRTGATASAAATSSLTAVGIGTTTNAADINKALITVTCTKASNATCNVNASDNTAPVSGDKIKVKIDYQHRWITPFGGTFGTTFLISRSTEMRVE